jgi:hypothetical protein
VQKTSAVCLVLLRGDFGGIFDFAQRGTTQRGRWRTLDAVSSWHDVLYRFGTDRAHHHLRGVRHDRLRTGETPIDQAIPSDA